jgi:hypothetical protein
LLDGLDVLFRIALGILRCNEQELLHCQSIPSVYVALENLPTRMWEGDKLLQVGLEFFFAVLSLMFTIDGTAGERTATGDLARRSRQQAQCPCCCSAKIDDGINARG